jgi:hypothetical protein
LTRVVSIGLYKVVVPTKISVPGKGTACKLGAGADAYCP